MSIYDQNYDSIETQLSPPDKRGQSLLAWLRVLSRPLQWLHDLFFGGYATGDSSPQYNPSTVYSIGSRVQFNHQVYEMWATPLTSGVPPTNTSYWLLAQDDFRGANERIQLSSQLVVFEYLLNQWFGTNFVQPVYSPPSAHSDIWIESTQPNDGSFIMYPNGSSPAPSYMLPSGFNEDFMVPSHSFVTCDFIVHYPVSVFNTSDLVNQLQALVNKYKLGGTIPQLQSY